MKKSELALLYDQYAPTREVLREKKGIRPEVVRKRNQCDWFSRAILAKEERLRKKTKRS